MDNWLRGLRRFNEALPEPLSEDTLSEDMVLGKAMFYTFKSIDNCFQHDRMTLLDYPTLPHLLEFEVFRDLGERQLWTIQEVGFISIWNDVKIVKLTKNLRLRGGLDDASIEE
ncbi:hypothetical protein DYB28_000389 [Aphanomyces astaci]|uniref:Uncharacterized protein n=1 Tax=Aphanomyces astaci TaxID=112090 RepID=A0A9X8EC73_APHAT|nr:hypothetical protein DYB28_000389 [Aphanomyces astaci]